MPRFSYALRPAKHIERRMLVDASRRLRTFAPLVEYQYVGFGSFEFVDFELVHRELGITNMLSIESGGPAERYEFNRPFSDVTIQFDRASNVLPSLLDSDDRRIIWLDYESQLNHEVLQDIGTALRRLRAGSALIVTVNAQPTSPARERRTRFAEAVGEDRVPPGMTDRSLAKWGLAEAQYAVLRNEVPGALTLRTDGSKWEQLFHFRYADGAQMLTWGGVLVAPEERAAWEAARFPELEQVRRDETALEIAVPVLTAREALHLNAQLPCAPADLQAEGIPGASKEAYAELYRWYPPVPTPI
jgi:hypothetical protein